MTRSVGDLSAREVCELWQGAFSQREQVLARHLPVLLASFSPALQERERKVLELYAGEGLTLWEIGVRLSGGGGWGISPSYVSKVFSRVCDKLCSQLAQSRPDTVVALGFRGEVIMALVERGVYTPAQLSQMTVRDLLELVRPEPNSTAR